MTALTLLAVCVLDGSLGDPRWLPHPVRAMGWVIQTVDEWVVRRKISDRQLVIVGIILAVLLPGLAYLLALGLINAALSIHTYVGLTVEIILGGSTIAMRDLYDHAKSVHSELLQGNLEQGRRAVGHMVGRDTDQLTEQEVVRGTVESTAESVVDGVVAPLFFLALGGVPLAMAFKAVSTLDSMVGYRRGHYRNLGWASAKLDDIANWIPARITACLMVLAGGVLGKGLSTMWQGMKILRRDAAKHPSPNSGWPEAAMAGALGVQLGGMNRYHGQPEARPILGDDVLPLLPERIQQALNLLVLTYSLAILVAVLWVMV